jgi:amidase
MWDGYPSPTAQMGPMARTVKDLVLLLDSMVGYDPEDPVTALGVGMVEGSYAKYLDPKGLSGARIGVLREPIGVQSEPESDDFKKVDAVFERNVAELKAAGAVVIDPIVVPNLKALLPRRANNPNEFEAGLTFYLARNPNSPIKSRRDIANSPELAKSFPPTKADRWKNPPPPLDAARYLDYLQAREELMFTDGRSQARCHRPQDRGTPTNPHQGWDQSALRATRGCQPGTPSWSMPPR